MTEAANAIIHIGAPKCGSSSLQAALSRNPVFGSTDSRRIYEYTCLIANLGALRGDRIVCESLGRASQYLNSHEIKMLAQSDAVLVNIRSELAAIMKNGRIPVLSSETWTDEAQLFAAKHILPRLGLNGRIVLFIRPQVPWINSGWWQWGAWSDLEFSRWIAEYAMTRPLWGELIERWQAVPGVHSVEVHLATKDVVTTFYRALGAAVPHVKKINLSLDAEILRFYQRHRQLRPSEHASGNDFVLERRLSRGMHNTPWVIPHDMTAKLIEHFRPDNAKLLSFLPPSERAEVENDPRWWEASAFADRQVECPHAPPTPVEGDALALRAIEAVLDLSARVNALEAQLRKARAKRIKRRLGRLHQSLMEIGTNGIRRLVRAVSN